MGDNIFRFTQAGSEVSALLGRIPSAVGYQPTLATDMGGLQERITSTSKGSITSVQAVYVPADDLTDPAPATTFAHLDATTVLSRAIAELGIYPAVDPLDSTSRIMDPNIIGEEHYKIARGVQKILQDYKSLQDIIAIWVWMSCQKKTSSLLPVHAKSNVSSPNLSKLLRSSPVTQENLSLWNKLLLDSPKSYQANTITCLR